MIPTFVGLGRGATAPAMTPGVFAQRCSDDTWCRHWARMVEWHGGIQTPRAQRAGRPPPLESSIRVCPARDKARRVRQPGQLAFRRLNALAVLNARLLPAPRQGPSTVGGRRQPTEAALGSDRAIQDNVSTPRADKGGRSSTTTRRWWVTHRRDQLRQPGPLRADGRAIRRRWRGAGRKAIAASAPRSPRWCPQPIRHMPP